RAAGAEGRRQRERREEILEAQRGAAQSGEADDGRRNAAGAGDGAEISKTVDRLPGAEVHRAAGGVAALVIAAGGGVPESGGREAGVVDREAVGGRGTPGVVEIGGVHLPVG